MTSSPKERRESEIRLHFLQLKQREYLSCQEIMSLSDAAQGVNMRLVCFYWDRGSLSSDPSKLAKLVGSDPRAFKRLWEEIKPLWTVTEEGGIEPAVLGLAPDRAAATGKVQKNRDRSGTAKGGRPRDIEDGTGTEPGRNQMVPSDGTGTEHISETESDTDKPKEHTLSEIGDERAPGEDEAIEAERLFLKFFAWFKREYPRRGPNGIYKWPETEQISRAIVDSGEATTGQLARGLMGWKAVAEASKDANTDFIKTPSKWLKEKGWLDEYPVILKVEAGGKGVRETEEEIAARRAMVAR